MANNEIDFKSVVPPTQQQFNDFHAEPVDYGEDGYQLLGMQYTKEEAVAKFTEHWKMLTGNDPDFDVAESVGEGSAGWSKNPDVDHVGEYCFVWLTNVDYPTDQPRLYNAWLLQS